MNEVERIKMMNVGCLEAFSDKILNAVNLRRIFLLLTQLHYSSSSNYGPMEEQLKEFIWSKDKDKSKLSIELDYVFNPTRADNYPCIFVGIGDLEYTQQVIANREGFTEDRSGSKNVLQGSTVCILRHASLSPDESLAMADLSFGYYSGIRELLMSRMKLKAFSVNKISTPRFFSIDGIEKADKKYFSDLILSIAFDASWISHLESHRIKKITLGQLLSEFE